MIPGSHAARLNHASAMTLINRKLTATCRVVRDPSPLHIREDDHLEVPVAVGRNDIGAELRALAGLLAW